MLLKQYLNYERFLPTLSSLKHEVLSPIFLWRKLFPISPLFFLSFSKQVTLNHNPFKSLQIITDASFQDSLVVYCTISMGRPVGSSRPKGCFAPVCLGPHKQVWGFIYACSINWPFSKRRRVYEVSLSYKSCISWDFTEQMMDRDHQDLLKNASEMYPSCFSLYSCLVWF